MNTKGEGERRLMSIVDADKLRQVLKFMLDENEFLSPYEFARCRESTKISRTGYR